MPLLRQLPRPVSARFIRPHLSQRRTVWAAPNPNKEEEWATQAASIKSGARDSMLKVLEQRGLVKDIAGGRDALDWLMTEKPIGAYVGVDPTAPSLHVGHLLPLMALYWMYLYGYPCVTLLGTGTVKIGDPSGRTTARSKQTEDAQRMNQENMWRQLMLLWTNVKTLGVRHKFPKNTGRERAVLKNGTWLHKVTATDLLSTLGSGMRLGSMLARDSVRTRMENGNGMSLSEFCYPLFQGYDWWKMYSNHLERCVQLQIGGSDQYGNICAGMECVDIMRKQDPENHTLDDPLMATFGITTPLLTTASGEKFGKSAGNAVWLDPDMLSSFDLYQYFLSTPDTTVESYLRLFTFLPLSQIRLVMAAQHENPSTRTAQHVLAKELVELVHGNSASRIAQSAHKNVFAGGSNTFYVLTVRESVKAAKEEMNPGLKKIEGEGRKREVEYKRSFVAAAGGGKEGGSASAKETPTTNSSPAPANNIIPIPHSLLQNATFPHLLYASGLCTSKSEAHRLIKAKGAYVLLPNSGAEDTPLQFKWDHIPSPNSKGAGADQDGDVDGDVLRPMLKPSRYLIDFEALVLRAGKSRIRTLLVVPDGEFEGRGLSVPGWEDFKMARDSTSGSLVEEAGDEKGKVDEGKKDEA